MLTTLWPGRKPRPVTAGGQPHAPAVHGPRAPRLPGAGVAAAPHAAEERLAPRRHSGLSLEWPLLFFFLAAVGEDHGERKLGRFSPAVDGAR